MREPSPDVALLKDAATLMRERAGRVPKTWRLGRSQIIAVGTDRLDGADVIGECQVPERAAYVASMHPGVALAVADLLDKIAWMGSLDPEMLGRVGCDEAIAIARAYLGEQP